MNVAAKLYRSSEYPFHWLAYLGTEGWFVFPARPDGWSQRRPASGFLRTNLNAVPLWLAFNTGLDEALQRHSRHFAA
jgi:hypothetical protein